MAHYRRAMDCWSEFRAWMTLALACVGGFVALRTYIHSARDRREAQARLVYVKRGAQLPRYAKGDQITLSSSPEQSGSIAPGLVGVFGPGALTARQHMVGIPCEVNNGSAELVLEAFVRITDVSAAPGSAPEWLPIGPIEPHAKRVHTDHQPNPYGVDGLGRYTVHVAFSDSTGRWWQRAEGGRLTRLRKRPVPEPAESRAGSHWKRVGQIPIKRD